MHSRRLVVFWLAVVACGGSGETGTGGGVDTESTADRLGCIKYGVENEVTGTLVRKDTAQHASLPPDRRRSQYTLRLPWAICAGPGPFDGFLPARSGVASFSLLFDSIDEPKLRNAEGRQINLRGYAQPGFSERGDTIVAFIVRGWSQMP